VTAIERIPIPDAGPQAVEAARLARARPAGFWVRVVAMLVDTALVGTVSVALAAAFAVGGLTATAPSGLIAFAIWGVVMVVSFAYPIVFWATKGSTPGKMLFHLAVVTASNKPGTGIGWGPAIVRGLGYVASSAIFGVGFLLVAFTSQKQGLHDLIAGTRVLKLR
jgi:uncharacterized RDD family membrane protein YckC